MTTTNKRHWYSKWWGVLILLFLLVFLSSVFALVFAFSKMLSEANTQNIQAYSYQNDTEAKVLIEGQSAYWLGSSEAQITIVEFGDYACSVCKLSFPKIRELSNKYKSNLKYIFRDYPVVTENSINLAMAANCAGEQGLFWVMHDKLFINQGVKDLADIKKLGAQIGLDTEKFNACLDTEEKLNRIKKDLADGDRLEIKGTPTFFINGQKFSGDLPYELLENIIIKNLNN